MEIRIEIFYIVSIVLLRVKLLQIKNLPKFFNIFFRAVPCGLVCGKTFKPHTDVVHIAHIILIYTYNACAACRFNYYMLLRKAAKRFADGRSANAEFFGKFRFRQNLSALIFTCKNVAFKLLENLIRNGNRFMFGHHFCSSSSLNSLNFASSSLLESVVDLPSSYSLSTHSFIF